MWGFFGFLFFYPIHAELSDSNLNCQSVFHRFAQHFLIFSSWASLFWNEALLFLIYPKQTSVPTWWFNRNWLSSKNEQQVEDKCMGHNQPRRKPSAEMQTVFYYLKQLPCSFSHFFFFTAFSWITSCWYVYPFMLSLVTQTFMPFTLLQVIWGNTTDMCYCRVCVVV